MFTKLGSSDTFFWIDLKHSFEEILHLICTILCYLLLGIPDCFSIAKVFTFFAKLLIPSTPIQMRVKF